jgi:hypothetical protein
MHYQTLAATEETRYQPVIAPSRRNLHAPLREFQTVESPWSFFIEFPFLASQAFPIDLLV